MTLIERPKFDELDLVTPSMQLVMQGTRGRRPEVIRLKDILDEGVAVGSGHARQMGNEILAIGQSAEITLAAVLGPRNELVYRVLDGFHRTGSIRLLAVEKPELLDYEFRASVKYGMTNPEIAEERIIATPHRSVQAARLAVWVCQWYEGTTWSAMGISAFEAFSLGASKSRESKKFNLEESKLQELRGFIEAKSELWSTSASWVANTLKIAQDADPNLVNNIRQGDTGDDGSEIVQQKKLALISTYYPGEKNYGLQRALVRFINLHRLTTEYTEALILNTDGKLIRTGMSEEEAEAALRDYDPFKSATPYPPSSDLSVNGTTTIEVGDEDRDSAAGNISGGERAPFLNYAPNGLPDLDLGDGENEAVIKLKAHALELEKEVASLRKALSEVDGKADLPWWKVAAFLSANERRAAELYWDSFLNEDEIAREMRLTAPQVMTLIKSGRAKHKYAERLKAPPSADDPMRKLFDSDRKRGRPSNASVEQRKAEEAASLARLENS